MESGEGGTTRKPPEPDPANAATVVRPPGDAAATRLAPAPGGGASPPARIGRYELRNLLGRGAMGAVYRAFDTQLKREVALKLLTVQPGDSGELFQRFRLEAEAAARLRHPNLVAVFDLGSEGGQPYLTMELLEGGSLARHLAKKGGRLSPHEAMRLVRDVALGLACAHEKGIVHRDLKPENILLEGDPEAPRPKISDFGLAHSVGRPGDARLTVHGTILGTPVYMAPEQAEGRLELVDARSDVYALGAVLYELAGGRPAYEGTDPMAVILEKLQNDPPPLRGLGRDLDTIIRKAMARDPRRRYDTAKELAEDLGRCLAGESILARPESAFESVLRRIRRHRSLSAAGAIVAIALTIAGGMALRARISKREQARLEAEALRLLRSVAETNLDASLALRRAGLPVSAQERFLARVEAPAREAIGRAPALAEPHYRLGRLYRALQRFDLALEEQEKAVAKEPGYAPARYERALLDLRRWEKRLEELRAAWAREEGRRRAKSGDPERAGAPPPDAELAAGDGEASALRDRIAGDLAALPAGPEESCLRGLVELHGATEADRADGERRVEQALAADPTLEEAYEGLARAAKARLDFEGAKRHYARGIAADAGYVPFRVGRAEVEAAEAGRAMALGWDPVPACERAAADLTRALELDPGSWPARLLRGKVLAIEGDRAGETGANPEELFARALADLTAAVEARPRSADALLARGSLHATWAYWRAEHALDPAERLRLAVADYDAAIQFAPLSAETWGGRGDVLRHAGRYEKNRGEDPRETYGRALADFARALELDPRSVALWTSRAAVREALSVFERLRGGAWRELLDGARADLDRALELEPRSTWIRGSRAQMDLLLAGCLVQDGEEPGAVYRRAIADLDALVAVQASVRTLLDRADCRIQWAEHEESLGRDGAELRAAARRDLDAIRADSAGTFEYGLAVGRLEILEARTADTPTHLQRAVEAFDGSVRLNPGATEAWMRRGEAARLLGAWEAARGLDPRPAWELAASSFDKALAINARWEEVWFRRGRLRLEEAAWRAARGEDAAEAFAAALADFEKAVQVNPASVEAWTSLGAARRRAPGAKPEDILDALDRAVRLGPNHPGARLERARARLQLGDPEGAAADAAWVRERVPAWRDECERIENPAR